jgi:hypothetical protein
MGLAAAALLWPGIAWGGLVEDASKTYSARIEDFEFSAAKKAGDPRSQSDWCWAACAQMVLKRQGVYVEQNLVAERLQAGSAPQAQEGQERIMEKLGRWAPHPKTSFTTVHAAVAGCHGMQMIEALVAQRPLIVALNTPEEGTLPFVLTDISFRLGFVDEALFQKVVLRDPWPGHKSRQELSWKDFKQRLKFVVLLSASRPIRPAAVSEISAEGM